MEAVDFWRLMLCNRERVGTLLRLDSSYIGIIERLGPAQAAGS
jgi:hypothetical protein